MIDFELCRKVANGIIVFREEEAPSLPAAQRMDGLDFVPRHMSTIAPKGLAYERSTSLKVLVSRHVQCRDFNKMPCAKVEQWPES